MIFKDPDIWDPPEPIQRNKSNQKIYNNPTNSRSNNKNFNVNKTNPKNSQKKIKGEEKKSEFLMDRYPNGQGPDANLIEMLERDVIDSCPNVTFDDIAEL